MPQQQETTRTPAGQITLEAPKGGGARNVAASTLCVNAGPKYRALDRDGTISAIAVDPRDLMPLAATIVGSLVYVKDPTNGHIPAVFRLRRVAAGRPSRLPGAS